MLEKLRNELLGKKLSCKELDDIMTSLGFE